ncbi:MAG: hypothetical protein J5999_08100 [Oscillospiraceae bacterium]|nr:hypothetical protein [Oscillospiraceae bacterium]
MKAIVSNYHDKTDKKVNFCIFIDDLDRLEPRIALELLEQLKNFMDFSSCVYVLAIDQKVVNQGLKKKYGEEFLKCENGETRSRADKFFDKLIQVPFPIPQNSYDLTGFIQGIIPGLEKSKAEKYSQLLKGFNIYNPRSIKRYLNLCELYCNIMKEYENEGVINDADFNFRCFAVNVLKFEKNDAFMRMADKVLENLEEENEKAWKALTTVQGNEDGNKADVESFPDEKYYNLVLAAFEGIDCDERLAQLRSIIKCSGYDEEITEELKGVITLKKLLRAVRDRKDIEKCGIELSSFKELLNGLSIKSIWGNIISGVTAVGTDSSYLLKIGVSTKLSISRIYLSVFLGDRCKREETEEYISKNTSFALSDNMDMSDLSRSFYFVNSSNYLILYFGNNDSAVEDVLKLLGFAGYLYDDRKGE